MSRELLFSVSKKDFRIDWFSGTGAGGQGRNKLKNTCRLMHIDSGAMATGQSSKSRIANQKEAFKGVLDHPKFKLWYNQRVMECLSQETVEERVQKAMKLENIKVEGKDDRGRWSSLGTFKNGEWQE